MRLLFVLTAFTAALLLAASSTEAQPGGKKGKGGKGGPAETADQFIAKLMAFNKAKDGKLTREELTDKRLLPLFNRADANKDGIVTREELQALFQREGGGGGFGGEFGGGGFGGGKKGFKGKGGPQFGAVLPGFLQDFLKLSDDQKKQVADLQKDVDTRLNRILTAEQRQQLRDLRERGPGGFGPGGKGGKKGPPPRD